MGGYQMYNRGDCAHSDGRIASLRVPNLSPTSFAVLCWFDTFVSHCYSRRVPIERGFALEGPTAGSFSPKKKRANHTASQTSSPFAWLAPPRDFRLIEISH